MISTRGHFFLVYTSRFSQSVFVLFSLHPGFREFSRCSLSLSAIRVNFLLHSKYASTACDLSRCHCNRFSSGLNDRVKDFILNTG